MIRRYHQAAANDMALAKYSSMAAWRAVAASSSIESSSNEINERKWRNISVSKAKMAYQQQRKWHGGSGSMASRKINNEQQWQQRQAAEAAKKRHQRKASLAAYGENMYHQQRRISEAKA